MFGEYWEDWFKNGWFGIIEKQFTGDLKNLYEDGAACIGLMKWKDGEPFEYWIGKFMPIGTNVPDGFGYHDFEKASWGVCWLYGKEEELYGQEGKCGQKLKEEGYKILTDKNGAYWFFERYAESRFMADEKGNSTLDICHYIE